MTLDENPAAMVLSVETHAGTSFANASILRELSAHGLVDRAWDTVVFDGELGDLPVYLIAPGEDASTKIYAEQVLGPGPGADRFARFLTATRERFLAASSNAKRIYAPAGTGHNFPSEAPKFVTQTLLRIASDVSGSTEIDDATYRELTDRMARRVWRLAPVDIATPATLEAAYRRAIAEKRAEVRAIADNPDPHTFANTVAALEASGLALARIQPLLGIFIATKSTPEIAAVAARVAPLAAELEDEIAHDKKLFSRIEAVYTKLPDSAPTPEARRLVAVMRDSMQHRGAALDAEGKRRLEAINGRLAALITEFQREHGRGRSLPDCFHNG